MRKKSFAMLLFLLFLCVFSFAQSVRVQYMCGDRGADSDSRIQPDFRIINDGLRIIDLGDLSLRYYYSKEGDSPEVFYVEYARLGRSRVKGEFKNGYLEVSFRWAGYLSPRDNTGPINLRFHKRDWSNYNELNDYSYKKVFKFVDWTKVTCYYRGKLIWGEEPQALTPSLTETPSPSPSPSPTPTLEPTLTPSPSPTPVLMGDVDENGRVDIVDALLVNQFYVGVNPAINTYAADVNNDGIINMIDVLMIAQYFVGDITDISTPLEPPENYEDLFVENEGTVSLDVKPVIPVEDSFTLDVQLEPFKKSVGAYAFTIYYDSNYIQLDSDSHYNGIEDADGFVTAVNSSVPGEIIVTGFDIRGMKTAKDSDFIRIHFTSQKSGQSKVRLEVKCLMDIYGLTIGSLESTSMDLRIVSEPPPTPTPTATPSPAPTTLSNIDIPGAVFIQPEVSAVRPGDLFDIECHVNSGESLFAAYGIIFNYNSEILEVNSSQGINGVDRTNEGFVAAAHSDAGTITVAGFDMYGIGPGNNLHVFDVHMRALKTGESDIDVIVESVLDVNSSTIGSKMGLGAKVIVDVEYNPVLHNPGQVWFEPSSLSLSVGNTFYTDIHLDTGTQDLAAYDFMIYYDETLVEPDLSYGMGGVKAGADGFVIAANPSYKEGVLKVVGFEPLKQIKFTGHDLDFLSIRWKAKEKGELKLLLDVPSLINNTYDSIGEPVGDIMPVRIIDESGPTKIPTETPTPSPTPTLTPTPTPTITPSPSPTIHITEPEAGVVFLQPDVLSVKPGSNFVMEAHFDSGSQVLAAYSFSLLYDPVILAPDTSTGSDGITLGADGFLITSRVDDNQWVVAGFDVTGKGPGNDLHLLNFNFKTLGIGKTEIDVIVYELVDPYYNSIGIKSGLGAKIVVSTNYNSDGYFPGQLWFEPKPVDLKTGSSFQTEVHVNSGYQALSSYEFTVEYDADIVEPDNSIGFDGVVAGKDGYVAAANADFKPGVLKVAGFKAEPNVIGEDIHLVTINWKAKCRLNTSLEMDAGILTDENYNDIGTPMGDSAKINIHSVDVPLPTLTPTSEPTITPTPINTPTPVVTTVPTPTPVPLPSGSIEGAGDVWMTPQKASFEIGDTFTATIHVNTGIQPLAAYGITIKYDPKIIKPDTSVGSHGVTAGAEGFVLTVNDQIGELLIAGIDIDKYDPDVDLELLDIAWIAMGTGSTSVDIDVMELRDIWRRPLGVANGISSTISVKEATGTKAGQVSFGSAPDDILTGMKFPLDIFVNTGTESLAAFAFDISYDPDVLSVDTSLGELGVDIQCQDFLYSSNVKEPGLLKVNGLSVKGSEVNENLLLLTVYWKALGPQVSSPVELKILNLVKSDYEDLGIPKGDTILVNIHAPTTTPSEKPTVTPTPTATPTPTSILDINEDRAGVFFLRPESSIVAPGQNFDIQCHVNSEDQLLAAYMISLGYDSAILKIDSSQGNNGVSAASDGFLAAVHLSKDKVSIAGFDAFGKGPGSDLHILDIHFQGLKTGESNIDLLVNESSDEVYSVIGEKMGLGARVIVSDDPNLPLTEPGQIWFEPASVSLLKGNTFSTEVHINTGVYAVEAFDLMVYYDETLVEPVKEYGIDGVAAGPKGYVGAANAQYKPGVLKIVGVNYLHDKKYKSDDLDFLSIKWKAKSLGETNLSIEALSLLDEPNLNFGIPKVDTMKLNILSDNPAPTPSLVPTPTTSPAVTPTPTPINTPTPSVTGPEAGVVFLEPKLLTVAKGEDFVIEAHVNTGNQALAGYGLELHYDSQKISPDLTYDRRGVIAGSEGFLMASNFVNDIWSVSGFDVLGVGPDNDLELLVFYFTAQKVGQCDIDVVVNDLVDASYNGIGAKSGQGASILVTNNDNAYLPGQLWFEPEFVNLKSGSTFKTEVHVNTGTQSLCAYEFTVEYDEDIVEPDISLGIDGVVAGSEGYLAAANADFKPGVLKVAGFRAELDVKGEDIHLVTINWKAKSRLDTSLDMKVEILKDENYNVIGTPMGEKFKITIDSVDVPLPTQIPTPIPSNTPTPVVTLIPTPTPVPLPAEPVKGAGDMWLTPREADFQLGSSFTSTVHVNTGIQPLNAYGIKLLYDPAVIAPDISVGKSGVTAGAEGYVVAVQSNPGELLISGFDIENLEADVDFELVDITWICKGIGSTSVEIVVREITDFWLRPVGIGNGLTSKINVSSVNNSGAGHVSFGSVPDKIATGKVFSSEIYVNTGDDKLGAYAFDLTFDPDVLAVDTSQGISGVEVSSNGFVAAVNAKAPGQLFLSGFDANNKAISNKFHLLTIYWKAIGVKDDSAIELKVRSLVNTDAVILGEPKGDETFISVMPD